MALEPLIFSLRRLLMHGRSEFASVWRGASDASRLIDAVVGEVVPGLVEVEVAVPRLTPAVR